MDNLLYVKHKLLKHLIMFTILSALMTHGALLPKRLFSTQFKNNGY